MRVAVPGFVKIYGDRLLRSTLWVGTEPTTKVVWITMLALADQYGCVQGSLPGLAHAAGVSMDDTVRALEYLKAPDPHSQTKDHEGRRIKDFEGGWMILNYVKYREFRSESQIKAAARKQEWRDKTQTGHVPDVPTSPTKSRTEAEAEADTKKKTTLGPQVALAKKEFQSVYPRRNGSQRWPRARQRFDALVRNGVDPGLLVAKAQAYAIWCVHNDKIGTELVQQAASFLGGKEGWKEDWASQIAGSDVDRKMEDLAI